jgi:hypothetical protein
VEDSYAFPWLVWSSQDRAVDYLEFVGSTDVSCSRESRGARWEPAVEYWWAPLGPI